jgi:hypothetical protein
VRAIRSDLRDVDLAFDLRNLRRLEENRHVAFQGVKLVGRRAEDEDEQEDSEHGFIIDRATADHLLASGGNPNGRPNSDVVRAYWSGDEALGKPRDRWVIDFGPRATQAQAQAYAAPYAHLERIVQAMCCSAAILSGTGWTGPRRFHAPTVMRRRLRFALAALLPREYPAKPRRRMKPEAQLIRALVAMNRRMGRRLRPGR